MTGYHIFTSICAAFVILVGLLWTFAPLIYGIWCTVKTPDHVCTTDCHHSTWSSNGL